jgi:hypothetical protein
MWRSYRWHREGSDHLEALEDVVESLAIQQQDYKAMAMEDL